MLGEKEIGTLDILTQKGVKKMDLKHAFFDVLESFLL